MILMSLSDKRLIDDLHILTFRDVHNEDRTPEVERGRQLCLHNCQCRGPVCF